MLEWSYVPARFLSIKVLYIIHFSCTIILLCIQIINYTIVTCKCITMILQTLELKRSQLCIKK